MLEHLSDTRTIAALAIVLSYLALSAYWLRPVWRKRSTPDFQPATTLIAFATQTGYAHQIASQTAQSLQTAGRDVRVVSVADIDLQTL